MTSYDPQKGDILASVDAVYQVGVTDGKTDQRATDQPIIDQANAQFNMEQAALVALQAVFDKYKLDNPPVTPPPPPPPPPAKLLIGMNFIHGTTQTQEKQARVARIFVPTGASSVATLAELTRAIAAGVDTVIFSWKDTSVPKWFGTIPKAIKKWYGVAHHEPEEMTATAWKALQAAHMPAVRAAGGIPACIFTNYSLSPKNTTIKLADWVCPAGTHDALGVDFYPDKAANMTQPQAAANWKAALKTFGLTRLIVGEYGVIGTASDAVADIKEIKPLIADLVEVACYWSQQASGEPDYHFTTATAAAWFS